MSLLLDRLAFFSRIKAEPFAAGHGVSGSGSGGPNPPQPTTPTRPFATTTNRGPFPPSATP